MGRITESRVWRAYGLRLLLCLALAALAGACAAAPPPNTTPRPNEPPYPVLMMETPDRRGAALAAWEKFTTEQGIRNAPAPELQPVTATIRSLPALSGLPIYLPKIGEGPAMTEEETRESLKRFIAGARALLGAEPRQLSLVQRTDHADGTKSARYEQRPFRYPLRGDYGVLEITFAPDRRVTQITSTCIPEIEQLQRAGAGTRPHLTADKVPELIAGRTFTYLDAAGQTQTLTIDKGQEIVVRELVILPRPRPTDSATLEFHLAWEILVGRTPNALRVYLDAVEDDLLAVNQFSK